MKLTKAHASQMPYRDGDGYSWGGEAVLTIGTLSIVIGSGKDALALTHEIVRRWNADYDDTPAAGRRALATKEEGDE